MLMFGDLLYFKSKYCSSLDELSVIDVALCQVNLMYFSYAPALRQGGSVAVQGSKDPVASDSAVSSHPVILQRDMTASPSGAGSPTASSRQMAVASPKRLSTTNLARDPRTGKGTCLCVCLVNNFGVLNDDVHFFFSNS